jgi:putative membrane protein
MWGWMGMWMLIFWAGVVVLAIWVASWLFPSTAPHSSSAREILDLRYARGELTQEQYRQMRQQLAPPRPRTGQWTVLMIVLVLLALVLLSMAGPWGMHGPWMAPWDRPGWHP